MAFWNTLFIATLSLIACTQLCSSSGKEQHYGQQNTTEEQCKLLTWFFWNKNTNTCECGPSLGGVVHCNQTAQRVSLNFIHCMTYDSSARTTFVGECPFSAWQQLILSSSHPLLPQNVTDLNGMMCGKANREGLLCSKCKPGYGPAVFSYMKTCAKCSDGYYGWFLYILTACGPTTVFLSFILLFQVRTTSAPLNVFVLACQLLSVSIATYPQNTYPETKVIEGILVTFLTAWNLEFFRQLIPPFCVSGSLSNLQVLCMEYVVALYPLLLTVLLYICIQRHARGCKLLVFLWKPFGFCCAPLTRRFNCNPADSIVHVFASFLLLSSTKIVFVSFSVFQQFTLFQVSDGDFATHAHHLYYEPSSTVFSKEHLPFACLAIAMVFIFVLIPCIMLTLYPTKVFQRCLNHCGFNWHAVHAFADAFNGCYKDGTNGSHDYRYFAGFYLFIRICYFVVNSIQWWYSGVKVAIIALVTLYIFAIASPYKSRVFNFVDSFVQLFVLYRILLSSPLKDIMNVLGVVLLFLYILLYCWWRICIKSDCQCTQREISINRWCTEPQGDIPDRMLNPDEYRPLAEDLEDSSSSASTREFPIYGAI